MKATITANRTALNRQLMNVERIAPKRSPKAILQSSVLRLNGRATIESTDLECFHTESLDVDYDGELDVVVDVRQIRKAMPKKGANVRLSIDSESVVVNGASIPIVESVDEFPVFSYDESESIADYSLESIDLVRLITQTVFATDSESSRYSLGGCLVEFLDTGLCFVGTDGRRLAQSYHGNMAESSDADCIIPAGFLATLAKALKFSKTCLISLFDNHARFIVQDENGKQTAIYRSRLVEGRFPKWRDVFPSIDSPALELINIDRDSMQSAIDGANALATDESRGLDFESFATGSIWVEYANIELGEFARRVDAFGNHGSWCHDGRFIAEFLKVCGARFDMLASEPADGPMLYRCQQTAFNYLVMPLSRDKRG